MNKFAYTDEEDKSYGLTGMAISLNIYDQQSMLAQISLDAPDGESISFTPDFFFDGNPRLSACIAWNEMLRQYQLLTGMVLGNIMCRYMVRQRQQLTRDNIAEIFALIEGEGRDDCQLEQDEIETIFNRTYNNLSRIYSNPQVSSIARRFAEDLRRRRSMTGNEVDEEIDMLRR